MQSSLRALLTGLIDYAGLFPPAGLPLDQAIRNYARYQQEPESWMLGRFVCPVKQFDDLLPFVEGLFDSRRPLHLSALGPPGDTKSQTAFEGTLSTYDAVRRFENRLGDRATGDAIEYRLPDLGASVPIQVTHQDKLSLFFEPVVADRREVLTTTISEISASFTGKPAVGGLKLRCGGLHASAFPTPEQVAFTIAACRDAKIPLKFTAGLHHPIRHFSAEMQTHMHGFVNVFVAGVLADARGLSEEQLRSVIEDEDASDFRFDDEGLSWKDYRASTEEIVRARRDGVTSFGSCSFDEPRDDLRKLGWLP